MTTHRYRAACTAAAVAAVLVAPAPPARATGPSAWPQTGQDSGHSYYNGGESRLNAGTVASLKQRWHIDAASRDCPGSGTQTGPVVAGGLTLTQDLAGLHARDSRTGRLVWRADTDIEDRTVRNLLVAGSKVIVTTSGGPCYVEGGSGDGRIVAFDLRTGAHLWRFAEDTQGQQVVVVNGVIVVSGTSSGVEPIVTGRRLTDGKLLWSDGTNSDGARTLASVIPVGRQVIVDHFGRETLRLDAATGEPKGSWPRHWTPLAGAPAGDRVFVSDSAVRRIKAVRASDLRVLWSVKRVSDLVATDGRRLYVSVGSKLEAYEAGTGKLSWTAALAARAGQPVRAGGLVYVPVAGRPPAVRDAATGKRVVASPALSAVRSVLAVAEGRLYATTTANRITVFAF